MAIFLRVLGVLHWVRAIRPNRLEQFPGFVESYLRGSVEKATEGAIENFLAKDLPNLLPKKP